MVPTDLLAIEVATREVVEIKRPFIIKEDPQVTLDEISDFDW
jgi:hypothetical protein